MIASAPSAIFRSGVFQPAVGAHCIARPLSGKSTIRGFKLAALVLGLGLLGFGLAGCGESSWQIDRIQPNSHLHSIPVALDESGHKPLAIAVRNDLPKGTSLAIVKSYIQQNFIEDGHLVIEDTIAACKSRRRAPQWPPRIQLRLIEGGVRFAGDHHVDLTIYFDDDDRLDDADSYIVSDYL